MVPDTPAPEPQQRHQRRAAVMAAIRDWIATGRLQPGERLPTFTELRQQFNAGQTTVRQALAHLQEQGFIETRAAPGVFVAATPPHVRNLGVTFSGHPGAPKTWSTFYTAIEHHLDRLAPKAGFNLVKFYREVGDLNQPETRTLKRMIEEHQLACLLLSAPTPLTTSEWLRTTSLPLVAISSGTIAGKTAVCVDGPAMYDLAFKRLYALGRRRVAVLLLRDYPQETAKQICLRSAEFGLMTRPHWIQAGGLDQPHWTANVVELLFRQPPADRPDALFIADDHMVTAATAGLVAAGVAVPGGATVVAHCHLGFAPPTHVPVQFVGTDIKALVATCLERLAQLRRGETPPALTLLPPRWLKPK